MDIEQARSETLIETGLQYRPGDPVRIRVVHRAQRIDVTDDGAAFERAAPPRGWREVARRLERELLVNVTRHGVVSLPVVQAGPPEPEVVQRIAEASLTFFEELLEL